MGGAAGDITVSLSVWGNPAPLAFPMRLLDCAATPVLLSASPSLGVFTGGNLITVRVANVGDAEGVAASFGPSKSAARVASAVLGSGGVLTAVVETPESETVGMTEGTLVLGSGVALSFPFLVSSPCDFSPYCAEAAMIPDPWRLRTDPPAGSECSPSYCLDPGAIPRPELQSAAPSAGPVGGGSVVTVLVRALACLSLDDVTIRVGSGASVQLASPLNLTSPPLSPLSSLSALTLATPPSPSGPGAAPITVSCRYGDAESSFSFRHTYFYPPAGPPLLADLAPQALSAADPSPA
eukprot:CAMPEP_0174922476 /NCGR_PEP_ID=MMETSP1355-20121228/5899_1 /TAXON_ID=464990 /ORGANISM="Hemiselmis tepida, Strain CCMP443" /LENGTH=294 /DNA_ID=CAMNT_0016168061 /DNA_START=63 /DNA_END=943 /DNA_ORIENTATION=+